MRHEKHGVVADVQRQFVELPEEHEVSVHRRVAGKLEVDVQREKRESDDRDEDDIGSPGNCRRAGRRQLRSDGCAIGVCRCADRVGRSLDK